MAQTVKLRRSSVSGQKPTNSNLQLGELALNTTDGKVYMAKSGSLGASVEELVVCVKTRFVPLPVIVLVVNELHVKLVLEIIVFCFPENWS